METTLILALTGSLLMASPPTSTRPASASRRVTVIAHRGDSKEAPENTIAAFRRALSAGADYVELDARLSADGTLYCLHDETLDRTTNAVRVLGRAKVKLKDVHDAQLAELDAGGWFDRRFAGERLPTLAAALDAIQAKGRTLLEHKDGPAEAYARLLREKELVGRLTVQSFDWKFLADLHKIEPKQPLAALGDKKYDEAKRRTISSTGAKIVAWKHTDLTPELLAEFRRMGLAVWVWTADEAEDWERVVAMGVEGIITNRPGPLAAWLDRRAKGAK